MKIYFQFYKKLLFLTAVSLLIFPGFVLSKSDSADFRDEDKFRIWEAVRIFNECGNKTWKSWDTAPFAILLVTNENEYLIYHNDPSEDFRKTGYDTITGSEIYTRPRQFSNNMLATFPAVKSVSTIVVGLPENTGRQGTDWIITILHEHFHQMQSSHPEYYQAVESLDLAGDDKSGMWMLNYKFPYDDNNIADNYNLLTQLAKKTYLSSDNSEFKNNLVEYLSEREKFKSLLDKKDYDYFSFQIWQEGIARYTEIKIAECLKNINYNPPDEIKNLKDYITIDSFYVNIVNKLLKKADTQNLSENGRNCFYTLGALEGLILDRINPNWKDLYFSEKFYIEKYFGK
ncbi:MAG TPA: hypothetical protein PKD83_01615 [Ignavibacteria bacterium]|nr:hypothetical protein [Ignavibacteria bacterium]